MDGWCGRTKISSSFPSRKMRPVRNERPSLRLRLIGCCVTGSRVPTVRLMRRRHNADAAPGVVDGTLPEKSTSWWRPFVFGGAPVPKADALLALKLVLSEMQVSLDGKTLDFQIDFVAPRSDSFPGFSRSEDSYCPSSLCLAGLDFALLCQFRLTAFSCHRRDQDLSTLRSPGDVSENFANPCSLQ